MLDSVEEGAVHGDAWWLGGALGCRLMEDLCLFNADDKAKELIGSCEAGGKLLQGSLCVSDKLSVICQQHLSNESLHGFGVCLELPKVEEAHISAKPDVNSLILVKVFHCFFQHHAKEDGE
jgi:hypothetical protein